MTSVEIPAFVVRGAEWWDPSGSVYWRTEADLRDALAASWWLHGADVRTEVKVPDCGRIDVLVTVGSQRTVIEIKRKITTPSEARAAFQQVHAYVSFLDSEDFDLAPQNETRNVGFVVAAKYDYTAARRAAGAYYLVTGMSYSAALREPSFAFKFQQEDATHLADVASRRQSALLHLTALSRRAQINRIVSAEAVGLADLAEATADSGAS